MSAALLAARLGRLTPRQREVLLLWAQGNDLDAIAAALVISRKTADAHLQQIRVALTAPPGPGGTRWLCYALGQIQAAQRQEDVA